MVEGAENTCCAAWKKKHSKLLEKYVKLEELKNKFRDCTSFVNQQYDVIEKENGNLKQELENLKAQAERWKAEKEQEHALRVDLESEVSTLKEEILLLQQNGKIAPNVSDRQLQERLDVSEIEINHLKELLEKERQHADLEKKNADMEKKNANEALKKLEVGKNKVCEAQKAVDIGRKKAEENKVLCERFKSEIDAIKSRLCLEQSKSEALNKKLENERQNTIKERKRADSAAIKTEEQQKLAETNLKKAMVEKDRANELDQKLKDEKRRTEKLEEELYKYLCSRKLAEAHVALSNVRIESELTSDVGTGIVKKDALISQGIERMVNQKNQSSIREKKCADSEMQKSIKHRKVAESHKKKVVEENCRANQLSRELEGCKQMLEELQKKQQMSGRISFDNPLIIENSNNSDRATVKLLKKQLKLEKKLVKRANEVTKVEIFRNDMLHEELFRLKKGFHHFQKQLDMLDDCFTRGGDIIHELEKASNGTFMREKFYADGYHRQLLSGIDSRLNPPRKDSYRKMSKSSALNSSTASFSDQPLMGSQERGAFSFTISAKPGEDISNCNPSLSGLSGRKIASYSENVVAFSEKNLKSPGKGNADEERTEHQNKRKILGAVESIEKLYSKGQKLHERASRKVSALCDMLRNNNDHPGEQNLPENSCREQARPPKRRKTSCETTKVIHPLHNSDEPKGMLDSGVKNSNVGMGASSGGLDVRKHDLCLTNGRSNVSGSTDSIYLHFEEMPINDYMMLLDLDNAADEKSYRIAVATPLSPTLPDIPYLGCEAPDTDNADLPLDKKFREISSNIKDNLAPTSGFHTFDVEKDIKHRASNNLDMECVSDACLSQNQEVGEKLGMPSVSGCINEKTHLSCESGIALIPGGLPKYLASSLENKDSHSISRIIQTISRCKLPCDSFLSVDVCFHKILLSLKEAEDLSSKERACVFFSVIMLGISEIEMKNSATFFKCDLLQSLDSVTLKICSVLADLAVRGKFMESLDLFELLAQIEDFLLQRKVLVFGDLYSVSSVISSSKTDLVVNGGKVVLTEQMASVSQLAAGGCLLASLCLEVNLTGFVCETSCELFEMKKFDPAMVLVILHSFAHMCGSDYFTLQPYMLAMTVVKSLVMFLEKQGLSSNYISTLSSLVELPSKTWSCCSNCPFLEGAVSMEALALLLLENLQKYGKSCTLPEGSLELMNFLVPTMLSNEKRTKEVSGVRQSVPLSAASNESLSNFIDILSLVEIVAHCMGWEWTFVNIIGRLIEILESHVIESFCAAIIVLFSQLGRLGVNSKGYEDIGVKKLRDWLSAFFCQSTSRNLSFPVQFATITALFDLIPVTFEEFTAVESQSYLSLQSIPTDSLSKWLSLLSKEQQLFFRLHQTTGKTKS